MSEANYKELLARLATEPEFAARVRADPGALKNPGFGLTDEEAESLAGMAQEGAGTAAGTAVAAAPAAALETRRSKSTLVGGGAAAAAATGGVAYLATRGGGGRGLSGSRYALELDGTNVGYVRSVGGGAAISDVVNEKVGPDGIVKKHLARVQYEDIRLEMGLDMDPAVYDWIARTWKRQQSRKPGAVVGLDSNGKTLSRMEFTNALLTEVALPAMDASAKAPGLMSLKITPERIRFSQGGSATIAFSPRQKTWLPANFRLTIDGLDCTRVNKIEAFAVTQKTPGQTVGESRRLDRTPVQLQIPDLRVTLAASHSSDWVNWHNDFVIKGSNGQDRLKKGTLTYLTPDLKDELGHVDITGIGIWRLAPETATSSSQQISRVIADLFCTTMDFHGPVAPKSEIPDRQAQPTPSPSPSPSPTPSAPASASPVATPSHVPTPPPSAAPSPSPVASPSPSASPSIVPSIKPSISP
jgi:phage tail-like protein